VADAGHRELRAELERLAGRSPTTTEIDAGDSYTAGGHLFYRVSVPDRRLLVRSWLSRARQRDADELWLLRSLTENHRDRVAHYLDEHRADLPAIALRETRRKLDTGTKTGRSRRS
jgi:hypothetical protein